MTKQNDPIIIKKYANRRLYNTATSQYITLDNLATMVKEGVDFIVYDAKTEEDITRSILAMIILDAESKGQNIFPIDFLRQVIRFYGDNLQKVLPNYLDYMMQQFSTNQYKIKDYLEASFKGLFPFSPTQDMGQKNLEMMQKTFEMLMPFNPFFRKDETPSSQSEAQEPTKETKEPAPDPVTQAMQTTIETLQKQVEALSKKIDDKE